MQKPHRIALGVGLAAVVLMVPVALRSAPSVAKSSTVAAAAKQDIFWEKVTYNNDGNKLVGYIFKPNGEGPFPTVIWNHGSEQNPTPEGQFESVAKQFVPHGYVVMCPVRRGQGESQGKYIVDVCDKERQAHGKDAASRLMVKLMETQQLSDQLAGLEFVKKKHYVDSNRLLVVGCSYGGIETLLGAESHAAGYKAAVALSPGAESWDGNAVLRQRLIKAADDIHIPVLLIHPEKDANVAPGYNLGPEFQRLNKPYGLMIVPPYGPASEQGHCFGGGPGMHIWGPSAVEFFKNYDR